MKNSGTALSGDACKLCLRSDAERRQSHVIPNFVFRWMRESSLGFLRDGTFPDRRVQDGPKYPWLCDACEGRLSQWEKPFAENVFTPIHASKGALAPIPYEAWALKFAVSISWRALLFARENETEQESVEIARSMDRAEARWRKFLLDEEEHPGPFEQHVLIVDAPGDSAGPLSPFIARYLTRTVHLDLLTSKTTCLTYAKLCRVIVIGFVHEDAPREWRGTKIHLREGSIGGNVQVPEALFHYWNDKAEAIATGMAGISARQKEKIASVFRKADVGEILTSEAFRAVTADVALSGKRAFRARAGESTWSGQTGTDEEA